MEQDSPNRQPMEFFECRRLENACQPLVPYLKRGHRVLDVGCGEGRATIDVAAAVAPGEVTGVDTVEKVIEKARSLQGGNSPNLGFRVADACALPWGDGSFDLCYSNGLFEWLREPERALREQMRVTKRGGWIVIMTASMLDIILYPPCPALGRVLAAIAEHQAVTGTYFNWTMGREVYRLCKESGLREVVFQPYFMASDFANQGSAFFDFRFQLFSRVLSLYEQDKWERFLKAGWIDMETVRQAGADLDAWHSYPHAVFANPRICAAGRVA